MKEKTSIRKNISLIIVSLTLVATAIAVTTAKAELVAETSIIHLAAPSEGQTLYEAGKDYHDVAVAKDGSFVVTWVFKADHSFDPNEWRDIYPFPVYARVYNADGTPRTNIIEICNGYSPGDYLGNASPRVACDNNGNFIVCWSRFQLDDNSDNDFNNYQQLYARLFDAEGNPQTDEFKIGVERATADPEAASVAMSGDGNFVVTWKGDRESKFAGQDLVLMMRFNKNGESMDTEPIVVNTKYEIRYPLSVILSRPSVDMGNDGTFAISWATQFVKFFIPGYGVRSYATRQMVRRYNFDRLPLGLTKTANAIQYREISAQRFQGPSDAPPVVAMNGNGDFAVNYHRYEYISEIYRIGIYHDAGFRFYSDTGIARNFKNKLNMYMRDGSLVNTMDNDENLIMAWFGCDSETECSDSEAIYLLQVPRKLSAPDSIVQISENTPYNASKDNQAISFPALDTSDNGRIVIIWHDNEKLLGRIYTVR